MQDHMRHIEAIARGDVRVLEEKERTYGGSWKRRGGIGAFMMLARKWDRLENIVSSITRIINRSREGKSNLILSEYDIFAHIESEPSGSDGSVLAEVRDLRRYLLLVESEMVARGVVAAPSHLSPAQEVMRRDMAARTEHPAPFGYSAADEGEPSRPGTPEDGGHHALQQDEEDQPETGPRQPRDATWKEWDGIRNLTIPSGTMRGERWGDIYSKGHEGRYLMAPEHVEEYGR